MNKTEIKYDQHFVIKNAFELIEIALGDKKAYHIVKGKQVFNKKVNIRQARSISRLLLKCFNTSFKITRKHTENEIRIIIQIFKEIYERNLKKKITS